MMNALPITPPQGYVYAGCPTCGRVFTVLGDGSQLHTPGHHMPWCVHHDSTYVWRPDVGGEWTQMMPVGVTAPVVTEREINLARAAYEAKRTLEDLQKDGGPVGTAWDTLTDALTAWEER